MREPAQRPLAAGELLLLDFGAQVDGYCADLTRTVVVGARADDRQRTIHELVQTAQRRAIEHLRPGMPAREATRWPGRSSPPAGFGEAFGHSLGHGLGLEVHEAPRLAPNSEAPLPRMPWSRWSRVSIFRAGVECGWKTMCTSARRAPSGFGRTHRVVGIGLESRAWSREPDGDQCLDPDP